MFVNFSTAIYVQILWNGWAANWKCVRTSVIRVPFRQDIHLFATEWRGHVILFWISGSQLHTGLSFARLYVSINCKWRVHDTHNGVGGKKGHICSTVQIVLWFIARYVNVNYFEFSNTNKAHTQNFISMSSLFHIHIYLLWIKDRLATKLYLDRCVILLLALCHSTRSTNAKRHFSCY